MAVVLKLDNPTGKDQPKHKNLKPRRIWDMLNIGYLGAGVATVVTAIDKINGFFFGGSKENPRTATVFEGRDEKLNDLPKTHPISEEAGIYERICHQASEEDRIYRETNREIDAIILNENGAKFAYKSGQLNPWEKLREEIEVLYRRLKKIKPHERRQVYAQLVIVGSVAAGAIFSFARERHQALKLQNQEERNDELQNRQWNR